MVNLKGCCELLICLFVLRVATVDDTFGYLQAIAIDSSYTYQLTRCKFLLVRSTLAVRCLQWQFIYESKQVLTCVEIKGCFRGIFHIVIAPSIWVSESINVNTSLTTQLNVCFSCMYASLSCILTHWECVISKWMYILRKSRVHADSNLFEPVVEDTGPTTVHYDIHLQCLIHA